MSNFLLDSKFSIVSSKKTVQNSFKKSKKVHLSLNEYMFRNLNLDKTNSVRGINQNGNSDSRYFGENSDHKKPPGTLVSPHINLSNTNFKSDSSFEKFHSKGSF